MCMSRSPSSTMAAEIATLRANQYSDLDISGGTSILGNVFGGLTISQ